MCLDLSLMVLVSLDGIEFSPSITCMKMQIHELDASKLPPLLEYLVLLETSVTVTNKFPDSLVCLTVRNTKMNGLDHFTPNSQLKKLVLAGVGLPEGTRIAHLPRGLVTLSFEMCYIMDDSAISLVDFPPNLSRLTLFHVLYQVSEIELPPTLTYLSVPSKIWQRIAARDFPSLECLCVYGGERGEFGRIPPSVRTLRYYGGSVRTEHLPSTLLFTDVRQFLDTSGQATLPPHGSTAGIDYCFCLALDGWNQFLVSTLIHYERGVDAECSQCNDAYTYRKMIRAMLKYRFHISLKLDVHDMLDVQVTLMLLLIGRQHPRCAVKALPVELIRFLSSFLL